MANLRQIFKSFLPIALMEWTSMLSPSRGFVMDREPQFALLCVRQRIRKRHQQYARVTIRSEPERLPGGARGASCPFRRNAQLWQDCCIPARPTVAEPDADMSSIVPINVGSVLLSVQDSEDSTCAFGKPFLQIGTSGKRMLPFLLCG